jgi:hypothetical protein
MSQQEADILARELGKLGGFGAKWAAKRLATVEYEGSLELHGTSHDIAHRVAAVVLPIGRAIPEFPAQPEQGKYSLLIGGGTAGLNPTIAHVHIDGSGPMTKVKVRAAAKEGIVKRQTAEGVVKRIESLLRGLMSGRGDR